MYIWIVASSSLSLANHSHVLQNTLRSALAKDTPLNTKEPNFRFAKHDEFQIVASNFLTNHSPFEAHPNQHQTAEELHSTIQLQIQNEGINDQQTPHTSYTYNTTPLQ
jgi:hypothetical protein